MFLSSICMYWECNTQHQASDTNLSGVSLLQSWRLRFTWTLCLSVYQIIIQYTMLLNCLYKVQLVGLECKNPKKVWVTQCPILCFIQLQKLSGDRDTVDPWTAGLSEWLCTFCEYPITGPVWGTLNKWMRSLYKR